MSHLMSHGVPRKHVPRKHVPIAMTIAGSDSGGGAGIQADIKVMSALGVFGTSAVTALTAQSTTAVEAVYPVPPDFVTQQIQTVWGDMPISAVKIGMLGTAQMAVAVAECLQSVRAKNIVLDPVMVAKSGDRLLQPQAIRRLMTTLVPMADIITPNIPEACDMVGGDTVTSVSDMHCIAERLLAMGCGAVLVKGGHMQDVPSGDIQGDIVSDVYMDKNTACTIKNPRIDTHNTHGTGCSLSSAIASYLARGDGMQTAVKNAISYIAGAVRYADRLGGDNTGIGNGNGPIYHFYNTWT